VHNILDTAESVKEKHQLMKKLKSDHLSQYSEFSSRISSFSPFVKGFASTFSQLSLQSSDSNVSAIIMLSEQPP
jgi:hypothetical protein